MAEAAHRLAFCEANQRNAKYFEERNGFLNSQATDTQVLDGLEDANLCSVTASYSDGAEVKAEDTEAHGEESEHGIAVLTTPIPAKRELPTPNPVKKAKQARTSGPRKVISRTTIGRQATLMQARSCQRINLALSRMVCVLRQSVDCLETRLAAVEGKLPRIKKLGDCVLKLQEERDNLIMRMRCISQRESDYDVYSLMGSELGSDVKEYEPGSDPVEDPYIPSLESQIQAAVWNGVGDGKPQGRPPGMDPKVWEVEKKKWA
ncbi:hypothetical protein M422DRAFT_251971 [Sphaerobolus stellatus SS14]|uniref:Uncharacterized protein n=1 Tax=Sphaerobolus stellatus (strain SS14) TaxID=990650 RepID=A0A0C9W153_SPHS4|nr:hypothetical protein M422DRAFT_251971 [Sphaerobolus stellatus SS14]